MLTGHLTDASIVIIDDQEANIELLKRLLRRDRYTQIHGITDPREAVARFDELAQDLVLLDLSMPFIDGFGVMEQIRPLVPADTYLPILVLTANIMPDVKRRALAAGAHDFLAKPLDATEVLLRVHNLLETRRLHCLLRAHNADLEAEVERRTTLFLQAEKLATMGELLGGVAHELNNPLSVVVGQTDLLAATLGPGPQRERALKTKQAAARCARIVRNFLEMARQRPPERGPVALNTVVNEALELLSHHLRVSHVEVVTDLDPADPVLCADGHQLHQVVVNLVNNARQALAAWDGPRQIGIRTRAREQGATVEIADSGPGIPADIQPRIFDAFFTTKPVGEGTGLGLSLCRGIVEGHGGEIRLESPAGSSGARFVIDLPAGDDVGQAPEPDEDAAAPALGVLVVDDEPFVAEALAGLLEYDGHRVDVCHSGDEALAKTSEREYDLLILDVRMPGLDGGAVYDALGIRAPALQRRVVFCSGDTLGAATSALLKRTGVPSLSKPFSAADVRQLVRRHAKAAAGASE